jgi:single-strand DNA-binding protein
VAPPVTNIRIATSESWTDKQSGEKKEQTEWHTVVLFGTASANRRRIPEEGLAGLHRGPAATRKWQDKQGNDRYTRDRGRRQRSMQMLGGHHRDGARVRS